MRIFLTLLLATSAIAAADTVPIIYITDLYHPHADPDDHFDLATLFAIPEFDIRAIVVDMGAEGKGRAGTLAIDQIIALTGREVPYATGLLEDLASPEDPATDQPGEGQEGVALILKALRESEMPLTVFSTGSLRDVAAAYNRAPDLFKEKVKRLYVNAGHSGGGEEYNVALDPAAYVRIMRSSLPIYWVPCFGELGFASYWHFRHASVLDECAAPLQQFFLYMLEKKDPAKVDPIEALAAPVNEEEKAAWWNEKRNMWCTGAFLHAAGRSGEGPYGFVKVYVIIDDSGMTHFAKDKEEAGATPITTFRQAAPVAYQAVMTAALRDLFRDASWKVPPGAPAPQ